MKKTAEWRENSCQPPSEIIRTADEEELELELENELELSKEDELPESGVEDAEGVEAALGTEGDAEPADPLPVSGWSRSGGAAAAPFVPRSGTPGRGMVGSARFLSMRLRTA